MNYLNNEIMKRNLFLAIMTFALASCGGKETGGDSDIVTSDILGDLPMLYADKNAQEEQIKSKVNAASSFDELSKIDQENKKVIAEINEKIEAQMAKLDGKDVKFSISDSLKVSPELYFDLEPTPQFKAGKKLSVIINPTMAITMPEYVKNGYQYSMYVKIVDSKGGIIDKKWLTPFSGRTGNVFEKGAAIEEQKIELNIGLYPELWSDFIQIIFCTESEYNNSKTIR